jgi:hypothetical protein
MMMTMALRLLHCHQLTIFGARLAALFAPFVDSYNKIHRQDWFFCNKKE